ncbi:MAG: anthranilate phosphoribosyltransferase [bacterium]
MIQDVLLKLIDDEELTIAEVEETAREIMEGRASACQIAALMMGLRLRGEELIHLLGFVRVMREKGVRLDVEPGILLDTCGTGGDETGTFNISTTAAFIAAGAGVRVAKHGNRSVSSKCGSADVLQALGVKVDLPKEAAERCLRETGVCFLFTPIYHGAMKHAAQPRKELGMRSIFNMLGPLSNPAGATHQLIGVYDGRLTELMARALRELGSERALVVWGADGIDEITTTSATQITELSNGKIATRSVTPGEFGFASASLADLVGEDAEANAKITLEILRGQSGPRMDIALLNAGAAIYVAEQAESILEGIGFARRAIESGAVMEKLEQLKKASNKL